MLKRVFLFILFSRFINGRNGGLGKIGNTQYVEKGKKISKIAYRRKIRFL